MPLIQSRSPGGASEVTSAATLAELSRKQILDAGNTTTIGVGAAVLFTGAWRRTRSLGFVRQLTVLASTVASGLGGTFTFEYSEDGSTATISEARTIGDFATVRDFDLLNAGEWYRVKFLPSRNLTAGELIFINTTQRTSNDGAFVRLATQQVEEGNAALPSTFSYAKTFDPVTGKSLNVRSSGAIAVTPAQSLLAGAGVYTSAWFYLPGYETIGLLVRADQVSATDGIAVQFSLNGSTVASSALRTMTAADATAGSKHFYASKRADYVRFVYTNGGTTQTIFSLTAEAIAVPFSATDSVDGVISDTSSATMVRSIAAGKDPVGGTRASITRTPTDASSRTGLHVGIVRHDVATPILALTSWKTGQATIASTSVAVNVIPAPTAGRKSFAVKALTSNTAVVYVGATNTVTSGTGYELAVGESVVIECDETTGVWVIGSTAAAQTLAYIEVAGT